MNEKKKKLTEGNVLEWVYHARPKELPEDYVPWDVSFTEAIRNMLMRGVPAFLKSSVVAFFCRPGLTTGEAVTGLGVK